MDNVKEMQAAYLEYRNSVYADYPQVKKFEEKKRRLLIFLLLSTFILNLAKAWIYCSDTQFSSRSLILTFVGVLIGIAPNIIFLLAAMTPRWKIAFVLYFPPAQFLIQIFAVLARRGTREISRFVQAYVNGFSQYPLIISLDILSWLLILITLGTAIWLTAVPNSRGLAQQSEKLTAKVREYIISHPIR